MAKGFEAFSGKAAAKKKPERKARMAATIGAAASMLECDLSALKAAKRAGAPGFRPNGSVNLDEVTEWLKHQPPTPPGEVTKASLEIRKLTAQCVSIEKANAIRDGEYTHNDELRADGAKLSAAMRSALQSLIAEVPTWEGLDAPAMEKKARALGDRICGDLHDSLSKLYRA